LTFATLWRKCMRVPSKHKQVNHAFFVNHRRGQHSGVCRPNEGHALALSTEARVHLELSPRLLAHPQPSYTSIHPSQAAEAEADRLNLPHPLHSAELRPSESQITVSWLFTLFIRNTENAGCTIAQICCVGFVELLTYVPAVVLCAAGPPGTCARALCCSWRCSS
jgi:hypothetical protein